MSAVGSTRTRATVQLNDAEHSTVTYSWGVDRLLRVEVHASGALIVYVDALRATDGTWVQLPEPWQQAAYAVGTWLAFEVGLEEG